jgi:hypothetical protein
MRFKSLSIALTLLSTLIIVSGCDGILKGKKVESPPGYDLSRPERFRMREDLLEISGIAFHNGNADTVYAIQDEDGRVFYFRPGDEKPAYTHFNKQGDYEDVAILNDNVIVLKSTGTFYSFPLANIKQEEQANVKESKKLLPKGEYEGLYADQAANKLYVLCKDCGGKKSGKIDGGYIFTASGDSLTQSGTFSITMQKLKKSNGKEDQFKPSALAKNPITGDWYILSANNNILLITDGQFNAKATYDLPASKFLQPEGIAFDKHGTLYISNEGDELESGNILKFKYQPTAKK